LGEELLSDKGQSKLWLSLNATGLVVVFFGIVYSIMVKIKLFQK
jgi:hypothetical protein